MFAVFRLNNAHSTVQGVQIPYQRLINIISITNNHSFVGYFRISTSFIPFTSIGLQYSTYYKQTSEVRTKNLQQCFGTRLVYNLDTLWTLLFHTREPMHNSQLHSIARQTTLLSYVTRQPIQYRLTPGNFVWNMPDGQYTMPKCITRLPIHCTHLSWCFHWFGADVQEANAWQFKGH
jgi:hypothetical protein